MKMKEGIIEGVTEKAGRVIQGKRCGDDIVKFKIRLVSHEDLLLESLEKLDSQEFLAEALAAARMEGFSLQDAVVLLDQVREALELRTSNHQNGYDGRCFDIKGSDQKVLLFEYAGNDPNKQGRVYVRGQILEQRVIIPAEHPLPEPSSAPPRKQFQNMIQSMLPIGNYGQFMLKDESATCLLRVVSE